MLYTLKDLKNKIEPGQTFILKKDDNCPNVGPNASISGMRKLYWGKNAKIAKKGSYIYLIG